MGPMAVTLAHTSNKEVAITATHIKWGKRSLVLELETLMREDRVSHKRLECIRISCGKHGNK